MLHNFSAINKKFQFRIRDTLYLNGSFQGEESGKVWLWGEEPYMYICRRVVVLPYMYADVGYSSCLPFLPLFRSRVVFLRALIPALFLCFCKVTTSKLRFKENFFTPGIHTILFVTSVVIV